MNKLIKLKEKEKLMRKLLIIATIIMVFWTLSSTDCKSVKKCHSDVCLIYFKDIYSNSSDFISNVTISGNGSYQLTITSQAKFYLNGGEVSKINITINNTNNITLTEKFNSSHVIAINSSFEFVDIDNNSNTFEINFTQYSTKIKLLPNTTVNHFLNITVYIENINETNYNCDVYVDNELNSQKNYVATHSNSTILVENKDVVGWHEYYLICKNSVNDTLVTTKMKIRRRDYIKPKAKIFSPGLGNRYFVDILSYSYIPEENLNNSVIVIVSSINKGCLIEMKNFSICSSSNNNSLIIAKTKNNEWLTFDKNKVNIIGLIINQSKICIINNFNSIGCLNWDYNSSDIILGKNFSGSIELFSIANSYLSGIYYNLSENKVIDFYENISNIAYVDYNTFHAKIYNNQHDFLIVAKDNYFPNVSCNIAVDNQPYFSNYIIKNYSLIKINKNITNKVNLDCYDQDNNYYHYEKNITQGNQLENVNISIILNKTKIITRVKKGYAKIYLIGLNLTNIDFIDSEAKNESKQNARSGINLIIIKKYDKFGNYRIELNKIHVEGNLSYNLSKDFLLENLPITNVEFYNGSTKLNSSIEINKIDIKFFLNDSYSDRAIIYSIKTKDIDWNCKPKIGINCNYSYFNEIGTRIKSCIEINFTNYYQKNIFLDNDINDKIKSEKCKFYNLTTENVISYYLSYEKDQKTESYVKQNNEFIHINDDFLLESALTCEEQFPFVNLCYKTSPFYISTNKYRSIYVTYDDFPPKITINSPKQIQYNDTLLIVNLSLNENSTCEWYSDIDTNKKTLGTGTTITKSINFYPPNSFFYNIYFICKDKFNNQRTSSVKATIKDSTNPTIKLKINQSSKILRINLSELCYCNISTSKNFEDSIKEIGNIKNKEINVNDLNCTTCYVVCKDVYGNLNNKEFIIEQQEHEQEQSSENGDEEQQEIEDTQENTSTHTEQTTNQTSQQENQTLNQTLINSTKKGLNSSTNILDSGNSSTVKNLSVNKETNISTQEKVNSTNTSNSSNQVTKINDVIAKKEFSKKFDDVEKTIVSEEELKELNIPFKKLEIISDEVFDGKIEIKVINKTTKRLNTSKLKYIVSIIKIGLKDNNNKSVEKNIHRTFFYFTLTTYTLPEDLNYDEISLYKSESGKEWQQLPTKTINITRKNGVTYYRYMAISNGFSYYVIAKKQEKKNVKSADKKQNKNNLVYKNNKKTSNKRRLLIRKLMIITIILLIFIVTPGIGVWQYTKKHPEEAKKYIDKILNNPTISKLLVKLNLSKIGKKDNKQEIMKIIEHDVEDLVPYIKEFIENNIPREIVEKQLLERGWSKEEIDDAYARAYAIIDANLDINYNKSGEIENNLEKISEFLKPYLIAFLKKGLDEDKIREDLLKKGWTPEEIDYSLFKAKNELNK